MTERQGRQWREPAMTKAFWETVGGTLVLEFLAVPRGPEQAPRRIDGVILLGGERRTASPQDFPPESVSGQRVITIQTKLGRLGMYLMGQAFFSRELLTRLGARVERAVAVCQHRDAVLTPLLQRHGVETWVCPGTVFDGPAPKNRNAP